MALTVPLAASAGCQGLRSHLPSRHAAPELAKATPKEGKDRNGEVDGQLASQNRTKTVGVLAGQVVDTLNRRCPAAELEIAPLAGGPAFKANADENGYFVIQGLEPGKQYRLGAHAKIGEESWGGATLAQPPNVVLLIKLTEKLPAGASASGRERDAHANPSGQAGPPRERDAAGRSPARLGSPQEEDGAGRQGGVPLRPEYITKEETLASSVPPMAQIRGPTLGGPERLDAAPRREPLSEDQAEASRSGASQSGASQALAVPLKTLDGKTTTLSASRKPFTLTLLWTSASSASAAVLPKLAELDRSYGPKGLSVAAVAYEDGKPEAAAQRLQFQADKLGLKYPVLLGGGDSCPLLRILDMRRYPTLVLLDDQGRVLWRGEGAGLDLHKLEETLKQRLK